VSRTEFQKNIGLRRFPKRTLLLMILALVAFARFWCITHPGQPPPPAALETK
jgi:hypothetical protein